MGEILTCYFFWCRAAAGGVDETGSREGEGGGEGGKSGRRDAETEGIGGACEEAGEERNDIEADVAEAV